MTSDEIFRHYLVNSSLSAADCARIAGVNPFPKSSPSWTVYDLLAAMRKQKIREFRMVDDQDVRALRLRLSTGSHHIEEFVANRAIDASVSDEIGFSLERQMYKLQEAAGR